MKTRSFLAAGIFAAAIVPALPASPGLSSGQASGTLSAGGKTFPLSHAAAFVDQSDERRPVILALTDRELPVAGWKSEFDYMRYRSDHPFAGVAFWIDKNREVFRTEYNAGERFPTSASGIFDLKLDPGKGKALSGSAVSTEAAGRLHEPVKLDARFNAAVK